MFSLLVWMFYGLFVGLIAKSLHPGDDPVGFVPTLGVGVAGSFVGGLLNWVLGFGMYSYEPAGVLMGVVGGVLFLAAYRWYRFNVVSEEPRSFISGNKK